MSIFLRSSRAHLTSYRHQSARAYGNRLGLQTEPLEERRLLSATNVGEVSAPLTLTPSDEFVVNATTDGDQSSPRITRFSDGSSAIAWQSDGHMVFQRFDANGAPLGAEVVTPGTGLSDVGIAADGQFVTVEAAAGQIVARRYDASASAIGVPIAVNVLPAAAEAFAQVRINAEGEFVVFWQADIAISGQGVRAQILSRKFDPDGVPTEQPVVLAFKDRTAGFLIDMSTKGDFVAAYSSFPSLTFTMNAIVRQADGGILGPATVAHSPAARPLIGAVSIDADGNFAIAYQAGFRRDGVEPVFVQAFDSAGVVHGPPVDTGLAVHSPRLAVQPGGASSSLPTRRIRNSSPRARTLPSLRGDTMRWAIPRMIGFW